MITLTVYSIMVIVLTAAAVKDFKTGTVSNIFPGLLLICGIAILINNIVTEKGRTGAVIVFAVAGMLFGLILTGIPALKGGMGGADVKIFAAIGLGLGFPDILTLMLLSFVAVMAIFAVNSLIRRVRKGERATLKQKIPLVPSICIALAIFTVYRFAEFTELL